MVARFLLALVQRLPPRPDLPSLRQIAGFALVSLLQLSASHAISADEADPRDVRAELYACALGDLTDAEARLGQVPPLTYARARARGTARDATLPRAMPMTRCLISPRTTPKGSAAALRLWQASRAALPSAARI